MLLEVSIIIFVFFRYVFLTNISYVSDSFARIQ